MEIPSCFFVFFVSSFQTQLSVISEPTLIVSENLNEKTKRISTDLHQDWKANLELNCLARQPSSLDNWDHACKLLSFTCKVHMKFGSDPPIGFREVVWKVWVFNRQRCIPWQKLGREFKSCNFPFQLKPNGKLVNLPCSFRQKVVQKQRRLPIAVYSDKQPHFYNLRNPSYGT